MDAGRVRALLDGTVPELMARARVPGVAVGVLAGAESVAIGFGVTGVEHPLPVDAHTLFQIGSVSKTFTAALCMALVERGRLALDDPVPRHLPGFRLGAPGLAERVTIRHLLSHTAGFLGDWSLVHPPGLGEGADALARLLDRMADVPQLFPPGTGWSYNNAGFSVAGHVVEVLAGRPYAEALRDLLLRPLALERTFVSADEAITHRVAMPHAATGGAPRVLRGAGWQPGWQLARADVPLGGLISCVDDLLRWARFHLPGAADPDVPGPPLRRATRAAMQEPVADAGCFADQVGIAWMLRGVAGRRLVAHGGLTAGYAAALTLVPDAGAAVVVLTNGAPGGARLAREVTRAVLREIAGLDDAPPAPVHVAGDGAGCAGRYDNPFAIQEIGAGARPGELRLEHHLRAPRPGTWAPPPPGPIRLAFYAPDRVVALEPPDQAGLRAEFGRDAAGGVAWFRWGGRLAPRLP
jgi:CubicO group peptidase (beta-lactamase class C family)